MEKKPEGFDYGNSPMHLLEADLRGKTIVHTTSSGTQGLANAEQASEVITGSFVNAGAIVRYIQKKNPESVSLVGMGYATLYQVEEDEGCAHYIANELKGIRTDFDKMLKNIRETSGARFFLEEKQHYAPREDFDLCMNLNRFDFVLKKTVKNGQMELGKITI
jgi:2-phosphosulfolactate phosphatase